MGMLVKLERSVHDLSVDFGNHLSALISGADGEYEYINAKFRLRDLEDPESGRRYDSPVARYEDPCLGPSLMQLDGQKGVECPALYVFRLSDTSVPMGFNQSWLEEMVRLPMRKRTFKTSHRLPQIAENWSNSVSNSPKTLHFEMLTDT